MTISVVIALAATTTAATALDTTVAMTMLDAAVGAAVDATVVERLLSAPFISGLGWWLVHALWQGTLVALVLAVALRVMPPRAATLRYGVSVLALVAIVVWPLYTVMADGGLSAARGGDAVPSASTSTSAGTTTTSTTTSATTSIGTGADAGLARSSGGSSDRAANVDAVTTTAPMRAVMRTLMRRVDAWVPWLVPVWLCGVLLVTLRTLGAWIAVRQLIARDVGPLPAPWPQRVVDLQRRLGVTRVVRPLLSLRAEVPAVIGCLRPVLLLPASALSGLTPQQLDAIIVHELAHVRRYDYVVNLGQHVVEIVLFFHPAVWWVSNRIRQEREHCCDDLAVLVCGDALTYSAALLALEEQRGPLPATRLAMAATHGRLVDRVGRLLGRVERRPGTWNLIAPLTVLVAGLTVAALAAQHSQQSLPSAIALPLVEPPSIAPPSVASPSVASASNATSSTATTSPQVNADLIASAPRRDLIALIDGATDPRSREAGISYLSGDLSPEAWTALVRIAATHADHETRKIAISYISGRASAQAFDALRTLYARAPTPDLKQHIVSYISGWMSSPAFGPAARDTLRTIAASDPDETLRLTALSHLAGQ